MINLTSFKISADTSRAFFHRTTHPVAGLAPDYANFDGTPVVTRRNQRSGNFSFDARRTQMNWADLRVFNSIDHGDGERKSR